MCLATSKRGTLTDLTTDLVVANNNMSLSMSWLGFEMGIMLANYNMCGIMLVLRAVFNILQVGLCDLGA